MKRFLGLFLMLVLASLPAAAQDAEDPYRWLEEVEGDSALAWVEGQNARTRDTLEAFAQYDALYDEALAIITSDERIAEPSIMGDYLYNFWTDEAHPRGIWRRTTLGRYLADSTEWETLLDIDALGEEEGVNWAYKGASCLPPAYARCLVRLSRGGADAAEVREFDTEAASFVEDGFFLPEAKSSAAWMHRDTLLVSTDWGEGALTTSGYPRIVKRLVRGDSLGAAQTVFEAEPDDMGAWASSFQRADEIIPVIAHRPSFFEGTYYVAQGGTPVALDLPKDADPSLVGDQLVVYLRSEWERGGQTHPQGALVATNLDAFLSGAGAFQTVMEPSERQTIEGTAATKNTLLVSVLDNVRGALHRYRYAGGEWVGERVDVPDFGSVDVVTTSETGDRFFFTYSSFLQPTTLYLAGGDGGAPRVVKQLPAMFDADGLTVQQFEATSNDSTRVPYFVVHREGLAMDGRHPTQLYGYGGFEVALTPSYSALTGKAWIEKGGVYVVANIRGGGEFGPEWHRAAQKENRQRAYDDFLAVAEDLVARGITAPEHLGIRGGSNGGLLVGVALTQRPDLFGAVVVQVPLLDMLRYHELLAGASWMAEYGNPDEPEERAYIAEYSPYQNVEEDADYPRVLFTTTTRDDRVHPGHARKMAAKMRAMGHPVLYFENTEGGHGSGVTPEQQATMWALVYSYLWQELQ